MSETSQKPVLLSGIQPSGNLMLGNYFGAIKSWCELQANHDCYFVLVDLHAITVRQDPAQLRERSYSFLAQYLACGIDPRMNTIFVQSHVSAHAELAWLLSCFTYMGELRRMTQFKDKAMRHQENVNVGLFTYPVLMAADILLFRTNLVPVGEDQRQHLELTRDLAVRLNGQYGDVFVVPDAFIPAVGARIMSLQDPSAKMSKSDGNPDSYIALLDSPDVVRRKIQRAVTDSERTIRHEARRPGVANLMTIYSCVTGDSFAAIEERFEGKGYGELKRELADVVTSFLVPIRERYQTIRASQTDLDTILERGAQLASERASATLKKIHEALGLIVRRSE